MLKRQLYLVNIISLIVPILLVGVILLYNNYTMLYEHHGDMLRSDNLRIKSIIFEVTTSITNTSDLIASDPDVLALLRNQYTDTDHAKAAYNDVTLLDEVYARYTEISSITLYTENKSLFTYEHVQVVNEALEDWYHEHTKSIGYFWETVTEINQYNVPYQELQLYRKINVPNTDEDALLVISISNNYLKNRIDNNNLDVDITVNHDDIFFSTWGKSGEVIDYKSYQESSFFDDSGVEEYMGRTSMMEISTLKPVKSDDSIYVFSMDPYAAERIERIQMVAILIIVMSFVIPMIVIIRFTKQLTTRVDTLRTEMHRVTGGDYNIIETFKGNDELVDLFKDLQIMIHSIKERDEAIYESQIKEQQLISHQKEIELDLLASKINPHFLYNTLETIRMKAFNSKNFEVAEAVKLLGKYMRYNLESTGELTTLASEIDYINIYLSIQKLRFADRIDFDIKIDDSIDMKNIHIMPLLVQPIVENALIHGHEETLEDGHIWIRCLDQGDHVQVEVKDNGIGMSPSELEQVKEQINIGDSKSSFGLFNIQQRLKLFYGENYSLKIESKKDIGTTISFNIAK